MSDADRWRLRIALLFAVLGFGILIADNSVLPRSLDDAAKNEEKSMLITVGEYAVDEEPRTPKAVEIVQIIRTDSTLYKFYAYPMDSDDELSGGIAIIFSGSYQAKVSPTCATSVYQNQQQAATGFDMTGVNLVGTRPFIAGTVVSIDNWSICDTSAPIVSWVVPRRDEITGISERVIPVHMVRARYASWGNVTKPIYLIQELSFNSVLEDAQIEFGSSFPQPDYFQGPREALWFLSPSRKMSFLAIGVVDRVLVPISELALPLLFLSAGILIGTVRWKTAS